MRDTLLKGFKQHPIVILFILAIPSMVYGLLVGFYIPFQYAFIWQLTWGKVAPEVAIALSVFIIFIGLIIVTAVFYFSLKHFRAPSKNKNNKNPEIKNNSKHNDTGNKSSFKAKPKKTAKNSGIHNKSHAVKEEKNESQEKTAAKTVENSVKADIVKVKQKTIENNLDKNPEIKNNLKQDNQVFGPNKKHTVEPPKDEKKTKTVENSVKADIVKVKQQLNEKSSFGAKIDKINESLKNWVTVTNHTAESFQSLIKQTFEGIDKVYEVLDLCLDQVDGLQKKAGSNDTLYTLLSHDQVVSDTRFSEDLVSSTIFKDPEETNNQQEEDINKQQEEDINKQQEEDINNIFPSFSLTESMVMKGKLRVLNEKATLLKKEYDKYGLSYSGFSYDDRAREKPDSNAQELKDISEESPEYRNPNPRVTTSQLKTEFHKKFNLKRDYQQLNIMPDLFEGKIKKLQEQISNLEKLHKSLLSMKEEFTDFVKKLKTLEEKILEKTLKKQEEKSLKKQEANDQPLQKPTEEKIDLDSPPKIIDLDLLLKIIETTKKKTMEAPEWWLESFHSELCELQTQLCALMSRKKIIGDSETSRKKSIAHSKFNVIYQKSIAKIKKDLDKILIEQKEREAANKKNHLLKQKKIIQNTKKTLTDRIKPNFFPSPPQDGKSRFLDLKEEKVDAREYVFIEDPNELQPLNTPHNALS